MSFQRGVFSQDAVSKGTFELLPGCASIVLERLVAIQAYISNESELKTNEGITKAMQRLYKAVSNLTQWADAVIVTGKQVKMLKAQLHRFSSVEKSLENLSKRDY